MPNFRDFYLQALEIYPPQSGYMPDTFGKIDLDTRHISIINEWIVDDLICDEKYFADLEMYLTTSYEGDHHILFEALVAIAIELDFFETAIQQ